MSAGKWVIVILIVLVVIGLVAYARGPDHHRGDDVGALRKVTTTQHGVV